MIHSLLIVTGFAFGEVSYEESAIFQPPPLTWPNFGIQVCMGDANGDGRVDLYVSNPSYNNGKGAGWVFYGPTFSSHRYFTVPTLIAEGPGTTGDWFGTGMWEAADLNGDGFDDLAVGASGPGEFGFFHGRAFVLWGPDYETFVELAHPGIINGVHFGQYGDIADVTGDGVLDLLVGVPLYGDLTKKGRIDVFDGTTGFVGPPALTLEPVDSSIILSPNGWGYGAHGGDVTGDGVPDVVTAQAVATQGGTSSAFLVILDGGDPTKTVEIGPSSLGVNDMGRSFLFVDMNGDAKEDLVCASRSYGAIKEHRVTVLWGPGYQTGITRACSLPSKFDEFFEFGVGDVNRDGLPDLVVGSAGTDALQTNGGRVTVLLGPHFQPGQYWDGPVNQGQRGDDVAVADVDGDGFAEFFVGAPLEGYGAVRVFTHHTLRALAAPQVSVSNGGAVPLSIECGQLSAHDPYYVLVSLSGATPGFDVPVGGSSIHVPLNVDGVTLAALALGNNAVFQGFAGQVDGEGAASATFQLPPGLAGPSLVGLELTFAAVLTTASGCADYATRSVSVTLEP